MTTSYQIIGCWFVSSPRISACAVWLQNSCKFVDSFTLIDWHNLLKSRSEYELLFIKFSKSNIVNSFFFTSRTKSNYEETIKCKRAEIFSVKIVSSFCVKLCDYRYEPLKDSQSSDC